MIDSIPQSEYDALASSLNGSLHTDHLTRTLYATDASVYRVLPRAVVIPKDEADVVAVVKFAERHGIALTARTAGTSLAGQAIGEGMVLDFSVHFTKTIEINTDEGWVRVQPGVIRDELNRALAPEGWWFSPNTSTASRCMIGGMVGNNSSGTTSIRYGVTRDKVLEARVVLSDGSLASFGPKQQDELEALSSSSSLEGRIYEQVWQMLAKPGLRETLAKAYPKANIHRRNTGYALDILLQQMPLNIAKLLAGAEGTLGLLTEVKLKLDPLPPAHEAVICAHFNSVHEAMRATIEIMKFAPYACELMDKTILDCTKDNLEQAENRFFVEGDPGAILAVELRADNESGLGTLVNAMINALQEAGMGQAFPVVYPPDTQRVWTLRAAGLGVLSNVKGDAKPLAFVEDTAVDLPDLPSYIAEFEELMASFGQRAVYYAHAGAGELHLRPVLDLKTKEGQQQFKAIGEASAALVKRYRGSLSGEHGDGRARSEFIAGVLGPEVYTLLEEVKRLWDPHSIFNPGIIVQPEPMDRHFRYSAGQKPFAGTTFLDFSDKGNILLAAEACNGSGDCRKPHASGATMCPSYQATLREADSTRARANMLREALTRPQNPALPLGSEALHEVLGLCLSCKACKRECPSSVDMALLKAEADYQYQRRNGFSMRSRFFGHFHKLAPWAAFMAPLSNGLMGAGFSAPALKRLLGINPLRSMPAFSAKTATARLRKLKSKSQPELLLYIDEFTQYQDAQLAEDAGNLLHRLGYRFSTVYAPSARAYMSKAMLPQAKKTAIESLRKLNKAVTLGLPVVGLEPSAILGFRDDLPKLFKGAEKEEILKLAKLAMTLEEFLSGKVEQGLLGPAAFHDEVQELHLHLHCHQKAVSHVKHSKIVLGLPVNYKVKLIPSGCCGMAGSFGYEEEHYGLSMQVGEMVLFPHIRSTAPEAVIVASGTSCRHQVADGTGRKALHPAQVLLRALKA